MVESIARGIIRWRFVLIVLTLLFVAWAASGARFLTLTTDYRVFFSEDNPQLTAFETLQNTYTDSDNVLLVIAPKNRKIFTRETLAIVEAITEESWQIPHSIRVDSISNYQHTVAEEDDLLVGDLITDGANLLDSDLQRIKNIALNEPLLVKRLISPTAEVTGINVTIQVPGKNQQTEIPEVVNFTRDIVNKYREMHPEVDIHLTGTVMMNNAFPEAAKKDMRTLVPFMFLVVFVCLWLLLRSITAVLSTILVVIFSIVTGMGLAGWIGITMTPPTGSAPTIILTLAVAHCVHILVTFMHNMQKNMDKQAAMTESLRVNFSPIALTSITTAIGFLSMNFSDAPPFRDLGNIVAMGVIASWVYSFFFMPALVSILPIRPHANQATASKLMARLGEFVLANKNILFWGNLVLVFILAFSITRNEFNDQFVEYFDETIEFRQATDFVTENLTGIYTIDYSINTGGSGSINEPDMIAKIEEFTDWLREQPEVLHVNTVTDIMKRLNKNLHGDDESWYRVPESRELAAQYLLLYEMSLPFGLDLNNQINIDKSATRITATMDNLKSNELLAMERRASEWLKNNAPEHMLSPGASPSIMFANITARNIRSMLTGNAYALLLISALLIFAFRSFKHGVISLIPNLLPSIMAFGVWGLLVGEIGVALSVVVSMTLGIVVDDTIHFMSKYLRARREQNLSPEDAIRAAFSSVGVALIMTSIVLMVGFLVLAASSFKMNAGMGLLTAITIGFALFADFLFLPPLLLKLSRKNS
ncbi:MAG: MMPL family transporter [Gammaproteobacteria bacterium]